MAKGVRPALRVPASASHGGTIRRTMIDKQLAVIATAKRRRQQALPMTDENRLLLKILLRSWSRITRRVSGLRARERAWHAVRSERLLGNAVAVWHNWAQKSRADDAEWAARVAMIQKRRLSQALVHFNESCKNSKRRRQLKTALRIVHDLSQRRPTKHRWCRWQEFLIKTRVKAAFSAWIRTAQRERRIRVASDVIRASKEVNVMVGAWNAWRRAAGAAKLGGLLGAWDVIGPVRRAVEVMQASAKMARAEQWRRLHLLRRGLHGGFTAPTVIRRQAKAAAFRAQNHNRKGAVRQGLKTLGRHTAAEAPWRLKEERVAKKCRKRTLRKGIGRWVLRHRSNLLIKLFQRRLKAARVLASIKTWAGKTAFSRTARTLKERAKRRALASCVERFQQNVVHRRANQKSSAAAAAHWRRSHLGHGLTCWCSRGRAIQKQQRSQGGALMFHRLGSLRRGMACIYDFTEQQTRGRRVIRTKNSALRAGAIARWREVVSEFRTNCKATSSHQARCLSSAISSWRLGALRLEGQRDLARAAGVHLHRRSLGLSFTLWRRSVGIVSGLELTVQRFQRQHHVRLGLSALQRWAKKRGLVRLSAWRAQVWAGTFCATYSLRKWQKHVKSKGHLEASFRIAENRRFTNETLRRRRCCFSPLEKHVFGALREHARARQLKRRSLKAWLVHTKNLARASKQAKSFHVRSGLRGLRSWAKLSRRLRERRLLALTHSSRRVTQSFLRAWKSTVFPLGLRAEWRSLRVCAHRDGIAAVQDLGLQLSNNNNKGNATSAPRGGIAILDEGVRLPNSAGNNAASVFRHGGAALAEGVRLPNNNKGNAASAHRDGEPAAQDEGVRIPSNTGHNAASSGETECLGLPAEATSEEQDGDENALVKNDSLVLLRLPIVGQRMRRVLHAWRKLAKKGKRLNYIRDMLPNKMGHVCPGPSYAASAATNNVFRNLDCGERENSENTLKLGPEKGTDCHKKTTRSEKCTGFDEKTLKTRSEKGTGFRENTLKTTSQKGIGCNKKTAKTTSEKDTDYHKSTLKTCSEKGTSFHEKTLRTTSEIGIESEEGTGCRGAPDNVHGAQLVLEAKRRTGCDRERGKVGNSGSAVSRGRRNGGGCGSDRADFMVDALRGGSGKSSGGSYLERYLSAEITAQERSCQSRV